MSQSKWASILCWAAATCILPSCLPGVTGCSPGTRQWYEAANPATSFTVNPINKTFSYYSNDGKNLEAEELGYKKDPSTGASEFVAKNLKTTDKAVEIKGADAQQMLAQGQMFKAINESLTPLISESIKATGAAIRETLIGEAGVVSAKNDDWKKTIAQAVGEELARRASAAGAQGPPPPAPASSAAAPCVLPANLAAALADQIMAQGDPCGPSLVKAGDKVGWWTCNGTGAAAECNIEWVDDPELDPNP